MLARREFPNHVKLAAFRRSDGHCESCGIKIISGAQYDHDKPDGLGGEPTLDNCKLLCSPCHSAKTHEQDNPIMSKADRIARKHLGLKESRWRR